MSLSEILGNRSHVRLLQVLFRFPDRWFTGSELASEVRMSPNTVHLALRRLEDFSLVERAPGGGFRLAPDHPLREPLRELFAGSAEAYARLAKEAAGYVPGGVSALLFGSAARGTAGKGSDVDVLVVGATRSHAVQAEILLGKALKPLYGSPIRFITMSRRELRARRGDSLVRSILAEGVPIVGPRLEAA